MLAEKQSLESDGDASAEERKTCEDCEAGELHPPKAKKSGDGR